jgi:hypothetical protein
MLAFAVHICVVLDENAQALDVPFPTHHEPSGAILTRLVYICVALNKHLYTPRIAMQCSIKQCIGPLIISDSDVGVLLQKQTHAIHTATKSSKHGGNLLVSPVSVVHICPKVEQHP